MIASDSLFLVLDDEFGFDYPAFDAGLLNSLEELAWIAHWRLETGHCAAHIHFHRHPELESKLGV
jgi:hypothetical protein